VSEREYDEPARSYARLWLFVVLLGIGFGIDMALGGGTDHIIGWLIAAALVLGFNWIVVYAVRSQKSLRLTADELRVGDEAVGRGEISGVTPGIDDALPVLGWPTGKPRGLRGITVRLVDGQDVVVPSRFPDRLVAALDVGAAPARKVEVRAATRAELPALAEIDERARTLFRTSGYVSPAADPATEGAVFVAGTPPVGYVRVVAADGNATLAALAVVPGSMRQGIGSALVERACAWARRQELTEITAIAYRDLAWSAPFLVGRGFGIEREVEPDEIGPRVLLRREV